MKLSVRQVLASAGGAVIAAVIASLFGVKGTIVGVAIGSAAATFGTALLAQSIDRGHQAVKQVVVRVPETSALLRRLGATATVGTADVTPGESRAGEPAADGDTGSAHPSEGPSVTEVVATSAASVGSDLPTVENRPAEPDTEVLDVTAPLALAAPKVAGMSGVPGGTLGGNGRRGLRWPVVAGTAAIVFILSLMFVTAIELIAGQPLADLFGGHSKGGSTTVQQIIESPPATTPASTTTSTSTTTTSSSTSTTSTTGSTDTSTTAGSTSSTDLGAGTTTSSTPAGDGGTTTPTTGTG